VVEKWTLKRQGFDDELRTAGHGASTFPGRRPIDVRAAPTTSIARENEDITAVREKLPQCASLGDCLVGIETVLVVAIPLAASCSPASCDRSYIRHRRCI
jgi:hypothetical protein